MRNLCPKVYIHTKLLTAAEWGFLTCGAARFDQSLLLLLLRTELVRGRMGDGRGRGGEGGAQHMLALALIPLFLGHGSAGLSAFSLPVQST